MTLNESTKLYVKIIEAGRELEEIKQKFYKVFDTNIEAFDSIHDKLAMAAFQTIILNKFCGSEPTEEVEEDFINPRIDQHFSDYLEMIGTTDKELKEMNTDFYKWAQENILFLLED